MRRSQISGMVGLVAVLCAAWAQSASAATYCVKSGGNEPPNCPLGADDTKTFSQALAAAAASTAVADTVLLAAGTFTAQTAGDFSFDSGNNATNDVTIQGAGVGQTTITRAGDLSSPILQFAASTPNADAILQDLTISMPSGFSGSGVFEPTALHRVDMVAQGAMTGTALRLSNRGTFDHMDIEMPLTGGAAGVYQPNGNVTITDSTIVADKLWSGSSTGSDDVLRNLRLHGNTTGLSFQLTNTGVSDATTADNIQIRMDSAAPAVAMSAPFATAGRFTASHLTILGNGGGASIGVRAATPSSPPLTINLANSIVTGVATPLAVVHTTGTATINATASVFSSNAYTNTGSGGSGAINTTASVAIGDPLLVDQGGLLYTRFDSPAIDRADPAKTTVGTDLLGQPRSVTGHPGGGVIPDAGAIEYQHRPPIAAATVAGPFTVGTPLAFTGGATDPDPGDVVTPTGWTFSDGTTATGATASHAFSAVGAFGGTFTVTDSTGLIGAALASGLIPVVVDKTKPVITKAAFSPKTFRASTTNNTATTAAKKKKRPPIGSTLHFTLSEPASASIVVALKRTGRTQKAGKQSSCKAPSKTNRKGHACTLLTAKQTLTRAKLVKGANAIAFSGRFHGRALPAGSYQAAITPKDRARNTGKAVTAAFTISR